MVQALHGPFSVELSHCKKVLDHHYFPDLLFHHFFRWGVQPKRTYSTADIQKVYFSESRSSQLQNHRPSGSVSKSSTLHPTSFVNVIGLMFCSLRMHKVYQNVHMASCILHVLPGASDQQKGLGLEICLRPVSWKFQNLCSSWALAPSWPLVFCWRSPRFLRAWLRNDMLVTQLSLSAVFPACFLLLL